MALKLGEGNVSYFALHRTREMNYLCVLHLASGLFSCNLNFFIAAYVSQQIQTFNLPAILDMKWYVGLNPGL
jgi:hypothetical protein